MKKAISIVVALVLSLSLAAYGAGMSSAADGTVYTIIIGESGSELTSNSQGEAAFKEYVEARSNGRLKVEIYLNAQLGSDRELLESTQLGTVTMMGSGLTTYTNFVPALTAMDAPFLYDNAEQVYALFKDKEFRDMVDRVYAEQGYHFVGMTFQGFRTLTSNKEIKTVADCSGLPIRVIDSPTPMAVWRALGANPTPISFAEVYTALQQGVVQAQENPMELIYSQKFFEQQKYIIDTNHQIQPTLLVMNLNFYKSLPDDLRALVDEGLEVCLQTIRRYTDGNAAMYKQAMVDFGCQFIEITPQARAEFQARTADVRASLAAQYPDFSKVLEAALGRIR